MSTIRPRKTKGQKIADLIPNYASKELKSLTDVWTNGVPVDVTDMTDEELDEILNRL